MSTTFNKNIFLFITLFCTYSSITANNVILKSIAQTTADFLVVGAGPAGVGIVAALDHLGVDRARITWIDPEFNGGDLTAYPEVPANAKNKNFFAFFSACKIFKECNSPALEALFNLPADREDDLINIITPIIEVTQYIRTVVPSHQTCVTGLNFENDIWHATLKNGQVVTAAHIILATGSSPVNLGYDGGTDLPLATALTPSMLKNVIGQDDVVTVVGGAHSAVLVLKNLVEIEKDGKQLVSKVINLFNSPITYMEEVDGGFLYPYSGVKGTAARWAHKNLDNIKDWPCNLVRMKNTEENRAFFLKESDKIVYAAGYKPNNLPTINGEGSQYNFEQETGVISGSNIGPRLFGVGLAFPGVDYDACDNRENMIGLQPFMEYAQSMLPEWISRNVTSGDEDVLRDLMKKYRTRRQELEPFGFFNIEVL